MNNNINEYLHYLSKSKNILISLLVGGLTGAVVMLLFAPQSGRETREKIYQESLRLSNRQQIDDKSTVPN